MFLKFRIALVSIGECRRSQSGHFFIYIYIYSIVFETVGKILEEYNPVYFFVSRI